MLCWQPEQPRPPHTLPHTARASGQRPGGPCSVGCQKHWHKEEHKDRQEQEEEHKGRQEQEDEQERVDRREKMRMVTGETLQSALWHSHCVLGSQYSGIHTAYWGVSTLAVPVASSGKFQPRRQQQARWKGSTYARGCVLSMCSGRYAATSVMSRPTVLVHCTPQQGTG